MLVLSRKKNERILIGDNVVLTVVEIRGDKIRLGIDAPRQVPVHRGEIAELIRGQIPTEGQREQALAASAPAA